MELSIDDLSKQFASQQYLESARKLAIADRGCSNVGELPSSDGRFGHGLKFQLTLWALAVSKVFEGQ